MKNNTIFTNVLGVLIAAGIIGIYTQINTLKDDVANVRNELIQYHTIVGFLQEQIGDLEEIIQRGRSDR